MELEKYSKKYIHYYTETLPFMLEDIFQKNKIKKIADLGTGDGSILYALFKKGYIDGIDSVIAVDISKDRIRNVKKINNRIKCIIADASKLDMLGNESLDLVISNQVIEHIDNENDLIKEAYRILAYNGLFYLSTIYKKWYAWYFYRCNGKWVLDPTHIREYVNENHLLDIFEQNRFKILENKKTLLWFPLTDFILKRIGMNRDIYDKKILFFLRNIKIPILGYYNWELLFRKK